MPGEAGRRSTAGDIPDVLNNNISHPPPPPGKRKKYNKPKRQDCTNRVNPEDRRREEIVGHEVNVPPSSNDELNQDNEVESSVCSDGAPATALSSTTPQPPPPPTPASPTPTPPPPRHYFPIFSSSKTQFKPRRKAKSKGKVLNPPKFKYQKLPTIFAPTNLNYPRVPDESLVNVRRGSDDKP